MKIFIIESPNPNDLLESRNEKSSLESMCKMFGHQVASFTVISKQKLKTIIDYISSIELEQNDFLVLHFSCHGNNEGIGIGSDFIDWSELGIILYSLICDTSFRDKIILIISACGANEQSLTEKISSLETEIKNEISPPLYVFIYDEYEVEWKNALLSWAILYHQLSGIKTLEKENIQNILERIKYSELGNIIYFRWDTNRKKYLRFKPKAMDE